MMLPQYLTYLFAVCPLLLSPHHLVGCRAYSKGTYLLKWTKDKANCPKNLGTHKAQMLGREIYSDQEALRIQEKGWYSKKL